MLAFLFNILATSKVISRQVPTGDSAHSWQLHITAPLGDQTTSTMTQYPTQSYNPDAVLTSSRPMLSTSLGSELTTFLTGTLHSTDSATASNGFSIKTRAIFIRH